MNESPIVIWLQKNFILIFAIGVIFAAALIVKQSGFSLTDYMADKVIQKLNANYYPYGPTNPPVAPQQTNVQPRS